MDTSSPHALLKQGIAAAKAARQKTVSGRDVSPEQIGKQRRQARSLLLQVLKADKNNIQAWLWLSSVVDTAREQKACFKNVLILDPHNKYALTGLARLKQLDAPATSSSARDDKNYRVDAPRSAPFAASPRKSNPVSKIQPSETPISAASQKTGAFVCPFCHSPVSFMDTTCPHCKLLLTVNCPACGKAVDVEESTCAMCGQTIGNHRKPESYFAELGAEYLENNRYQDAVKAWEMVEILNRDFPQLYVWLGQAHLGMNRPDRATECLQRALKQTPNDPDIYFTLGEMARLRVELEEAFEHYQTVIRLDPEHGLAWLRTGELFEKVRARKDAKKAYRQAVKLLSPDSEEYIRARSQLERLEPKLSEAMATGWLEFIRQITGPILVCILAALLDSGLRPWWINFAGWIALILASLGAFLFVSGSSLPRNPVMKMIAGERGLRGKELKIMITAAGALLWLMGMSLILLPINQSYPEIPEL